MFVYKISCLRDQAPRLERCCVMTPSLDSLPCVDLVRVSPERVSLKLQPTTSSGKTNMKQAGLPIPFGVYCSTKRTETRTKATNGKTCPYRRFGFSPRLPAELYIQVTTRHSIEGYEHILKPYGTAVDIRGCSEFKMQLKHAIKSSTKGMYGRSYSAFGLDLVEEIQQASLRAAYAKATTTRQ